jgi:hypothetical protein
MYNLVVVGIVALHGFGLRVPIVLLHSFFNPFSDNYGLIGFNYFNMFHPKAQINKDL